MSADRIGDGNHDIGRCLLAGGTLAAVHEAVGPGTEEEREIGRVELGFPSHRFATTRVREIDTPRRSWHLALMTDRGAPHSDIVHISVGAFGAVGDDDALDTDAFQRAIDTCEASGGGTVEVESGRYVVGTIVLKSNVVLHLHAGAVLRSSLNMNHFPNVESHYPSYSGTKETYKSIVYAEGARNIGVVGPGEIDGRYAEVDIEFGYPSFSLRPRLIHLRGCDRVTIRDVTLRDSATWVQHYRLCTNLTIHGVTVESRENPNIEAPRFATRRGLNQDGMDIDSCRNVRISNCSINSGDDGICLKSRSEQPCENVVVTNCTITTNASGLKLGTESNGGFRNVSISNCVVYDTRVSGIAITEVDGGICENVSFSNIVMDNVKGTAVFVRLGDRGRPLVHEGSSPPVGAVRNLAIGNVVATRIGGRCLDDTDGIGRIGCSITGIPGHPVEGVTVHHSRIRFTGGGSVDACLQDVPEGEKAYPSPRMFGGDLPAYGFYCRHVRDLRMHETDLGVDEPDSRPAIVLDDVERAHIDGLLADGSVDGDRNQVRTVNCIGVDYRR